jgi:hypothetical protein
MMISAIPAVPIQEPVHYVLRMRILAMDRDNAASFGRFSLLCIKLCQPDLLELNLIVAELA